MYVNEDLLKYMNKRVTDKQGNYGECIGIYWDTETLMIIPEADSMFFFPVKATSVEIIEEDEKA